MFHIHKMIIQDEHANAGGFQLRNRVFHLPVALSLVLTQIDFFKKPVILEKHKAILISMRQFSYLLQGTVVQIHHQ